MERIIVANRSGADVYRFTKAKTFQYEKSFENPEGLLSNREFRSDKPGVNRGSKDGSPYYLDKDKNEYDEVTEQFAKELAHELSSWLLEQNSLTLQVVAAPALLGKIRAEMTKNPQLLNKIEWIAKNLENVPQTEWASILDLPERPRFNHFIENIPDRMRL